MVTIAIAVVVPAYAVVHIPVVIDVDAGSSIVMSIVRAAVVRMTPIARMVDV